MDAPRVTLPSKELGEYTVDLSSTLTVRFFSLHRDGYMNTTLRVDKLNNKPSDVTKDAPSALIFKKYGGNKMTDTASKILDVNSQLTQSLICYEMSRRGWGPKLYGVIDDARIEEYVDGRPLHASEAFEEKMSRDVARAYARFHSLDLPLDRDGEDLLVQVRRSLDTEKAALQQWTDSAVAAEECLRSFKRLLAFPCEEEYLWVHSVLPKIQHRKVFCSMDSNYLNRIVRNDETADDRCMTIDYDISGYYNRGCDLAGHFVLRTLDGSGKESKLSGFPYPSEEERDYFLSRYLEECSQLFDDFDPQSVDNLTHLKLESDIYALWEILLQLMIAMNFHKIHHIEPKLHTIIDCLIDLHATLKSAFVSNHPLLV